MKEEMLQVMSQKFKKIIRDYYKQLYIKKLDNLEETCKETTKTESRNRKTEQTNNK